MTATSAGCGLSVCLPEPAAPGRLLEVVVSCCHLLQETDIDCGGKCPKCTPGKKCRVSADCQDGLGGLGNCPTQQLKYICAGPTWYVPVRSLYDAMLLRI